MATGAQFGVGGRNAVLVRDPHTRTVHLTAVSSLGRELRSHEWQRADDGAWSRPCAYEVWTGTAWTPIRRVICRDWPVTMPAHVIRTRTGEVVLPANQALLCADGTLVHSGAGLVGLALMQGPHTPRHASTGQTAAGAWILGLVLMTWHLVGSGEDFTVLKRAFGRFCTAVREAVPEFTFRRVQDADEAARWKIVALAGGCHLENLLAAAMADPLDPCVPSSILCGSRAVRIAFIAGLVGSGRDANISSTGDHFVLTSGTSVIRAGVALVLRSLGYVVELSPERGVMTAARRAGPEAEDVVASVTTERLVCALAAFSLETEAGRFQVGIGSLIVPGELAPVPGYF